MTSNGFIRQTSPPSRKVELSSLEKSKFPTTDLPAPGAPFMIISFTNAYSLS